MVRLNQIWSKIDKLAGWQRAITCSPLLRAAGWLLPLALVVYLTHQLTQLGWDQIWEFRPRGSVYYGVLALSFFVQPVADLLVYRNLWRLRRPLSLSVFLRKRFLNTLMLDYSGEAYFLVWANRRLNLPTATLIHSIKDSNVLSAGAGLLMVWLMLLILVGTGGLRLGGFWTGYAWVWATFASLPLLLCGLLVICRRNLTTLARGQIASTFAIHLSRSVVAQIAQLALWLLSGALASTAACVNFVFLRLLISRLPFVPNKDLIFVGTGLAAAGMMDLLTPAVAAVLVTLAAGELLLNLALVGVPWLATGIRVEGLRPRLGG